MPAPEPTPMPQQPMQDPNMQPQGPAVIKPGEVTPGYHQFTPNPEPQAEPQTAPAPTLPPTEPPAGNVMPPSDPNTNLNPTDTNVNSKDMAAPTPPTPTVSNLNPRPATGSPEGPSTNPLPIDNIDPPSIDPVQ